MYAIVTDVDPFPVLATLSVLRDDGGFSSDLGLAGLDLGSGVLFIIKN
jgi:hypothetical protein